ncbi:MAG: hypothetical protein ACE5KM_23915, partial [Planctomycetaceae bacterium]
MSRRNSPGILPAIASFLSGTVLTAVCVQTVLSEALLSAPLFSRRMWAEIVPRLGATRADVTRGAFDVGYASLFVPLLLGGCAALGLAAV